MKRPCRRRSSRRWGPSAFAWWTAYVALRFRWRATSPWISLLAKGDLTTCSSPSRRCYNLEAAKKPENYIKQELSKEDLYPDNTVRVFRAMC